MTTVLAKLPV